MTKKEINASNFFTDFCAYVNEKSVELDDYNNSKKLTKKLLGKKIEETTGFLVDLVKKEYGLDYNKEYYRLDLACWESFDDSTLEKQISAINMNKHLWQLKIAIEHENNKKDWTDELVKLAHISCPLKVLISYNDCSCRDKDDFGDLKKLEVASSIMKKIKAFRSLAVNKEEFLIILGNAGEGYDRYDYRGYVYDYAEGKFLQI